jgi:phosphate transport system permease protein
MPTSTLILVLAALSFLGYHAGRARSIRVAGGREGLRQLHSLPSYHGYLTAIWCAGPGLAVIILWRVFGDRLVGGLTLAHLPGGGPALSSGEVHLLLNDVRNVVAGSLPASQAPPLVQAAAREYATLQGIARLAVTALVLSLGLIGGTALWRRISPALRARNAVERHVRILLTLCSLIAIATTVGIVLSVLYEAILFFTKVSPWEFLLGTHWSPQMAIRSDQVGSSGGFGAVPLFAGTLLIACIAMAVAVPIGLFAAIYLAEYANPRFRQGAKPILEVLAGIPTVVYGFFAALTVGPMLRNLGQSLGLEVAAESALAAGLVMGIMIVPFISSLADDMITAVPQALRDGAFALGATRSETIRNVVLPAALPGIVGGILLGVSRAIGETMIVVMAAGLSANLTANPLQAVTTVTVQIVTLLVGDQEFDSPKTLAAFALGLVLFLVTLVLNVVALLIVRRYREQYE